MNYNNPFFSIIITSYNRADFVVNTIQSVLNQTFQDYEIMVVDDASTDNTREVLESFIQAKQIKYFRNKENKERAFSRNVGLDNVKGKYVTFIDSDDIMYKDNLSDAYNFISKNQHFKMYYNDYEFIDEKGRKIFKYEEPVKKPFVRSIAKGNFLACIGVFLSREIYTKHRFDDIRFLSGTEDWDFWLRVIADVKDLGHINKVNSAMVEHSDRSMNNLDIDAFEDRINYTLNKVQTSPDLEQIYRPYLNLMKGSAYLVIATNAAVNQRKKKAITYLFKALGEYPLFLFNIRPYIIVKNILFRH